MISYEILRIIRNPKCKYGLLIALGTFAFHSQMQQFLTSQFKTVIKNLHTIYFRKNRLLNSMEISFTSIQKDLK